jgi:hypothetical protein
VQFATNGVDNVVDVPAQNGVIPDITGVVGRVLIVTVDELALQPLGSVNLTETFPADVAE